jgi:hypothetical protein
MLPERLFRRLDRARLDGTLTRRALAGATPLMRALNGGHDRFRASGDPDALASGAQRLVDHFCEEFVVAEKRVELLDQPRPHKRKGGRIVFELHGQCRRDGAIRIFARTAAQQRPVALKTLLETLVHEFVHHSDFDCFGASVHCSGFYERLGQIYRPLREEVEA